MHNVLWIAAAIFAICISAWLIWAVIPETSNPADSMFQFLTTCMLIVPMFLAIIISMSRSRD